MSTTIYHNNRCRKSRETLQLLEEKQENITIINYLETVPTVQELTKIISLLGITPIQLIRKGEAIWKDNFKGKELSDAQLIEAMVTYPKLIERPIVVKNGKAAIGRPPENVLNIL